MASSCPACAAPVLAGDRFCESCGRNLFATAAIPEWLSSAAGPGECDGCGTGTGTGTVDGGGAGYCDQCGHRRAAGRARAELDLGTVAGATDRGRRKHNNEDALAIGRVGAVTVALVCDGISASHHADRAAYAAVAAGMPALLDGLAAGGSPKAVTVAAARAAAEAAAQVSGAAGRADPTSCTYVSAIVTADDVTVGSVGDSRAYWLAGTGATRLTTDDSVAERGQGSGFKDVDPDSLALTRWFGADARDTEPAVVVFSPPGPGRVLVCSDGLHRYRPEPADLAALTLVPETPAATARALTQLALAEGGVDNIAIAVLPFPPRHDTDPGGNSA